MGLESDDQILKRLVQPIPGIEPGEKSLVLRTLELPATPGQLKGGLAHNLTTDDELDFLTDFDGPWQCNIVTIKFEVMVGGAWVPNREPNKDFVIALVLGGDDFPIVERFGYRGSGFSLTDHVRLGASDQIKIWAKGLQGRVIVQVRGEKL